MRRIRWSLLFLIGIVVLGAGASSVLAGQATNAKTTTTYWNNVLVPSSQVPAAGTPIPYLGTTAFQFTDIPYDVYGATEVDLNFHGHVHSIQTGGGSGYATTLSVTVTGVSTGTFTVALVNPWRPHVAFNNAPAYGQDAYATLKVPTYIWKGANSLTVTVKSMTTNTVTRFQDNPLLLGYVTLGL